MEGEGMVAVVRGLRDAGLAVTVMDGSRQYTLVPNNMTQQVPMQRQQLNNSMNTNTQPCNLKYSADCNTDNGYGNACDRVAQAIDGRYASTYKTTHCRLKPTSPPVQLTEFPPQRADPCPAGHGNFQVGGSGSGAGPGGIHTQTRHVAPTTSFRGAMSWPDRGSVCSPRGSHEVDAFANSLRKYPCLSPDRSSEVMERLINYTQIKGLSKTFARSTTSPTKINEMASHHAMETKGGPKSSRSYEPEVTLRRKVEDPPTKDRKKEKDDHHDFRPLRNFDVRFLREVSRRARDSARLNSSYPYAHPVCPTIKETNGYAGASDGQNNSVNNGIQAAVKMISKEVATVPRDLLKKTVAVPVSPTSSAVEDVMEGECYFVQSLNTKTSLKSIQIDLCPSDITLKPRKSAQTVFSNIDLHSNGKKKTLGRKSKSQELLSTVTKEDLKRSLLALIKEITNCNKSKKTVRDELVRKLFASARDENNGDNTSEGKRDTCHKYAATFCPTACDYVGDFYELVGELRHCYGDTTQVLRSDIAPFKVSEYRQLDYVLRDWVNSLNLKTNESKCRDKKELLNTIEDNIKQLFKNGTGQNFDVKAEIFKIIQDVPIEVNKTYTRKSYLQKLVDLLLRRMKNVITTKQKARIRKPNYNVSKKILTGELVREFIRARLLDFFIEHDLVICDTMLDDLENDMYDVMIDSIDCIRCGHVDDALEEIESILRDVSQITEKQANTISSSILQGYQEMLNNCNFHQTYMILNVNSNSGRGTSKNNSNDDNMGAITEEDIRENIDDYTNRLCHSINEWLDSLNIPPIEDKAFKEVVVNDLAGDIVDRHKYLELHPAYMPREDEELEVLKYQIFKWINKLVGDDNQETIGNARALMVRLSRIPIPMLTHPSHRTLSITGESPRMNQSTNQSSDPLAQLGNKFFDPVKPLEIGITSRTQSKLDQGLHPQPGYSQEPDSQALVDQGPIKFQVPQPQDQTLDRDHSSSVRSVGLKSASMAPSLLLEQSNEKYGISSGEQSGSFGQSFQSDQTDQGLKNFSIDPLLFNADQASAKSLRSDQTDQGPNSLSLDPPSIQDQIILKSGVSPAAPVCVVPSIGQIIQTEQGPESFSGIPFPLQGYESYDPMTQLINQSFDPMLHPENQYFDQMRPYLGTGDSVPATHSDENKKSAEHISTINAQTVQEGHEQPGSDIQAPIDQDTIKTQVPHSPPQYQTKDQIGSISPRSIGQSIQIDLVGPRSCSTALASFQEQSSPNTRLLNADQTSAITQRSFGQNIRSSQNNQDQKSFSLALPPLPEQNSPNPVLLSENQTSAISPRAIGQSIKSGTNYQDPKSFSMALSPLQEQGSPNPQLLNADQTSAISPRTIGQSISGEQTVHGPNSLSLASQNHYQSANQTSNLMTQPTNQYFDVTRQSTGGTAPLTYHDENQNRMSPKTTLPSSRNYVQRDQLLPEQPSSDKQAADYHGPITSQVPQGPTQDQRIEQSPNTRSLNTDQTPRSVGQSIRSEQNYQDPNTFPMATQISQDQRNFKPELSTIVHTDPNPPRSVGQSIQSSLNHQYQKGFSSDLSPLPEQSTPDPRILNVDQTSAVSTRSVGQSVQSGQNFQDSKSLSMGLTPLQEQSSLIPRLPNEDQTSAISTRSVGQSIQSGHHQHQKSFSSALSPLPEQSTPDPRLLNVDQTSAVSTRSVGQSVQSGQNFQDSKSLSMGLTPLQEQSSFDPRLPNENQTSAVSTRSVGLSVQSGKNYQDSKSLSMGLTPLQEQSSLDPRLPNENQTSTVSTRSVGQSVQSGQNFQDSKNLAMGMSSLQEQSSPNPRIPNVDETSAIFTRSFGQSVQSGQNFQDSKSMSMGFTPLQDQSNPNSRLLNADQTSAISPRFVRQSIQSGENYQDPNSLLMVPHLSQDQRSFKSDLSTIIHTGPITSRSIGQGIQSDQNYQYQKSISSALSPLPEQSTSDPKLLNVHQTSAVSTRSVGLSVQSGQNYQDSKSLSVDPTPVQQQSIPSSRLLNADQTSASTPRSVGQSIQSGQHHQNQKSISSALSPLQEQSSPDPKLLNADQTSAISPRSMGQSIQSSQNNQDPKSFSLALSPLQENSLVIESQGDRGLKVLLSSAHKTGSFFLKYIDRSTQIDERDFALLSSPSVRPLQYQVGPKPQLPNLDYDTYIPPGSNGRFHQGPKAQSTPIPGYVNQYRFIPPELFSKRSEHFKYTLPAHDNAEGFGLTQVPYGQLVRIAPGNARFIPSAVPRDSKSFPPLAFGSSGKIGHPPYMSANLYEGNIVPIAPFKQFINDPLGPVYYRGHYVTPAYTVPVTSTPLTSSPIEFTVSAPCSPVPQQPSLGSLSVRKVNQEFDEYIHQWVQQIPIPVKSLKEQQDAEKARLDLYNGVWKVVTKMEIDPKIYNHPHFYQDVFDEELEDLMKSLPRSRELEDVKPTIRAQLFQKCLVMIEHMKSSTAPSSYKQQVLQCIENNLPKNKHTGNKEEKDKEELDKQNLADYYILHTRFKDEDNIKANVHKNTFIKKLNEFLENVKTRYTIADMDTNVYAIEIISDLDKIPTPTPLAIRDEADEILLGMEVDNWICDLPQNPSSAGPLEKRTVRETIVKKINELGENQNYNIDSAFVCPLKTEMPKYLEKIPLKQGTNVDYMVDELANRIKNLPKFSRPKSVSFEEPRNYAEFSRNMPASSSLHETPQQDGSYYVVGDNSAPNGRPRSWTSQNPTVSQDSQWLSLQETQVPTELRYLPGGPQNMSQPNVQNVSEQMSGSARYTSNAYGPPNAQSTPYIQGQHNPNLQGPFSPISPEQFSQIPCRFTEMGEIQFCRNSDTPSDPRLQGQICCEDQTCPFSQYAAQEISNEAPYAPGFVYAQHSPYSQDPNSGNAYGPGRTNITPQGAYGQGVIKSYGQGFDPTTTPYCHMQQNIQNDSIPRYPVIVPPRAYADVFPQNNYVAGAKKYTSPSGYFPQEICGQNLPPNIIHLQSTSRQSPDLAGPPGQAFPQGSNAGYPAGQGPSYVGQSYSNAQGGSVPPGQSSQYGQDQSLGQNAPGNVQSTHSQSQVLNKSSPVAGQSPAQVSPSGQGSSVKSSHESQNTQNASSNIQSSQSPGQNKPSHNAGQSPTQVSPGGSGHVSLNVQNSPGNIQSSPSTRTSKSESVVQSKSSHEEGQGPLQASPNNQGSGQDSLNVQNASSKVPSSQDPNATPLKSGDDTLEQQNQSTGQSEQNQNPDQSEQNTDESGAIKPSTRDDSTQAGQLVPFNGSKVLIHQRPSASGGRQSSGNSSKLNQTAQSSGPISAASQVPDMQGTPDDPFRILGVNQDPAHCRGNVCSGPQTYSELFSPSTAPQSLQSNGGQQSLTSGKTLDHTCIRDSNEENNCRQPFCSKIPCLFPHRPMCPAQHRGRHRPRLSRDQRVFQGEQPARLTEVDETDTSTDRERDMCRCIRRGRRSRCRRQPDEFSMEYPPCVPMRYQCYY